MEHLWLVMGMHGYRVLNKITRCRKKHSEQLGVFAEFETNLRQERQLEGIAAAKKKGIYKGRKKEINDEEIHNGCFEKGSCDRR